MNRRGSAIAEAAMVFPIILLSLMAVMYMLIYFYSQVDEQVKLHMLLRSEAGAMCENIIYVGDEDSNLSVYEGGNGIYGYTSIASFDRGILNGREKEIRAEKYLIDESLIVRMADLVKRDGDE